MISSLTSYQLPATPVFLLLLPLFFALFLLGGRSGLFFGITRSRNMRLAVFLMFYLRLSPLPRMRENAVRSDM